MLGPVVPILRSFDEASTKAFYLGFLGFETVFEHRFEPGLPLYLGVRRVSCVLHLSGHHGDAAPGSAVRIACDDVAGYAAMLRGKGYEHARPGEPELMPWGSREFSLHDPSHNRLIFHSTPEAA